MTATPTLHDLLADADAQFMPYGPSGEEGGVQIVATFGQYEAEYAAIRRHVGVMHLPQRGLLRFTGEDRRDFLHRMMTQDIATMTGGASRRAFQLSNKGRVVADAVVHHGEADTWLELDRYDIPATHQLLDGRLFAEDVVIEDWSAKRTALALLGPAAIALLEQVTVEGTPPSRMEPGTHHVLTLTGGNATAYRWDEAGGLGVRLLVEASAAVRVYRNLLEAAGHEPDSEPDADFAARRRASLRGRPIGWLAYNTARIEAGAPLFHIDFGTDSLPAETALLDQTVSFTKGCYLGQEVVARMKNLGHPKRILAGLELPEGKLPVAGAQVLNPADPAGIIGGITSSTRSPLHGGDAIAFAVLKWGWHKPGTTVLTTVQGERVQAQVHALNFLET